MFKRKDSITISEVIRGELALARRGRYGFGVLVIKSKKSKSIDSVQSVVKGRVRSYDFVARIDSRSCAAVLRNVSVDDIEKVADYMIRQIDNIEIDCYAYPVVDGEIKSVLECKECVGSINIAKKSCDIFFSLIILILLLPVCVAVALAIKLSSPGSVFFKQERVGYMGRKFFMYKFRTMHENVSSDEHQSYLKEIINDSKNKHKKMKSMKKKENSERIFPVGRIIRKYCIDEIPQFINVLKGDMSIVGPRPPVQYEVDEYEEWYKERFDVYPGLTGLWQVSGKNNLSFERMIKLDILYKKNCNILNDIKIMCMTPVVIFKQFI